MGLPAHTPDVDVPPQKTSRAGVVKTGTRTPEDPRKVAAREVFLAQQRLIDAEDALASAKANLADKTKAFDAVRNAGKRV